MEEYNLDDIGEWEFPDQYFEALRDLETNGSEYCIVQGALYEVARGDCRVSAQEAMQTTRYLNNGEVEEAESHVFEVLEGDAE